MVDLTCSSAEISSWDSEVLRGEAVLNASSRSTFLKNQRIFFSIPSSSPSSSGSSSSPSSEELLALALCEITFALPLQYPEEPRDALSSRFSEVWLPEWRKLLLWL